LKNELKNFAEFLNQKEEVRHMMLMQPQLETKRSIKLKKRRKRMTSVELLKT